MPISYFDGAGTPQFIKDIAYFNENKDMNLIKEVWSFDNNRTPYIIWPDRYTLWDQHGDNFKITNGGWGQSSNGAGNVILYGDGGGNNIWYYFDAMLSNDDCFSREETVTIGGKVFHGIHQRVRWKSGNGGHWASSFATGEKWRDLDQRKLYKKPMNFTMENVSYFEIEGYIVAASGPNGIHAGLSWDATNIMFDCSFVTEVLSGRLFSDARMYVPDSQTWNKGNDPFTSSQSGKTAVSSQVSWSLSSIGGPGTYGSMNSSGNITSVDTAKHFTGRVDLPQLVSGEKWIVQNSGITDWAAYEGRTYDNPANSNRPYFAIQLHTNANNDADVFITRIEAFLKNNI